VRLEWDKTKDKVDREVTYSGFVLVQHLIVLGHGDTEDDGGDVFEAVDPLLSFGSLTAHVEQLEVEVLERKVHLDNAGGLHSGPQNVLFGRHVLLSSKSIQIVQEAVVEWRESWRKKGYSRQIEFVLMSRQ
jgi:hypothetical protein